MFLSTRYSRVSPVRTWWRNPLHMLSSSYRFVLYMLCEQTHIHNTHRVPRTKPYYPSPHPSQSPQALPHPYLPPPVPQLRHRVSRQLQPPHMSRLPCLPPPPTPTTLKHTTKNLATTISKILSNQTTNLQPKSPKALKSCKSQTRIGKRSFDEVS